MTYFHYKYLLKKKISSQKVTTIWRPTTAIPLYLINRYIRCQQGVYFRTFRARDGMQGQKAGMYIMTRKFFNKPVAFQKRR